MECRNPLIGKSYLITLESQLKHNFYEFRDGKTEGKEDIIRALGRFVAKLHRSGVKHLDFSPGNILFDFINGEWQFEIVDINRMSFKALSFKKSCHNMGRLWGKRHFFEILGESYADAMNLDHQACIDEILRGREKFWRHRSTDHFVTDDSFSVGVIISTYNNPKWLEKTLWSLEHQSHKADEIIIADDGSTNETRELISKYSTCLPIRHIWHEDDGFRKTTILNKAVATAASDYLIFMDQDLIARRDFISQHCRHAKKGHFVSAGVIYLNEEISNKISYEDIKSGDVFRTSWLNSNGLPRNWKMSKLSKNCLFCSLMNLLTTTKPTWNGGNASTWREYIIKANGFDERMRYGAEDREFGQRLENMGIRGIQLRYGASTLHLWHNRPYKNQTDWEHNLKIWKETKKSKKINTEFGIWKRN